MMTITEKVAYLKGLAEGVKLDESTNEGKLITKMIDVLDDIALTVSDLEDSLAEIGQQVDEIDDDLSAIEEEWYDEDEEDGDIWEVECPKCGDTICVDSDMLEEGSINCPGCGENLEFDFDDCGCDCDCGCHGSDEE